MFQSYHKNVGTVISIVKKYIHVKNKLNKDGRLFFSEYMYLVGGKRKRGVNKERGGDIVIVISSNRIRAISQMQKQIEIKDIKNTHEEKKIHLRIQVFV